MWGRSVRVCEGLSPGVLLRLAYIQPGNAGKGFKPSEKRILHPEHRLDTVEERFGTNCVLAGGQNLEWHQ
jgi:hypothetical protein